MLNKIYLEITNVCNLDCSFCHKTSRQKKLMTEEEFETLTDKLQGNRARRRFSRFLPPSNFARLSQFQAFKNERRALPVPGNRRGVIGKGDTIVEIAFVGETRV